MQENVKLRQNATGKSIVVFLNYYYYFSFEILGNFNSVEISEFSGKITPKLHI